MNDSHAVTVDSAWSGLYRICGVATVLMMAFFLFDTVAWMALGPYPSSAEGWFTLLQSNRTSGFLLLAFPTLFGIVLYYLTFLGLYGTLRQVNRAFTTIAALFAFVGLAVLLSSYPAYTMVYLGDRYAAATSDQVRILLTAAGETTLASFNAGMSMGGFLVQSALVIFSVLMFRSKIYGKKTAYLGVLGHGLDLARIIMALTFLPEAIGYILLAIGGLPQFIWLILVGLKLYRLGGRPHSQ